MTTAISGAIEQYRDGMLGFDDLVRALTRRRYPSPTRYSQRSAGAFAAEVQDAPGYEEGTWDEVLAEAPLPYPASQSVRHLQRNSSWLKQQVAQETGLDSAQAQRAVDAVLKSITDALANGKDVRLTGFGSFHVTQSPPRVARNRRTGAFFNAPARRRPAFTRGSRLKQAVASKSGFAR